MIYDIKLPTEVLFGLDASAKTGEKLKELGVTKVLCIYDQGIKAVGVVDKIVNNVKAAGIGVVEYGGVVSDPPDTVVDEAGELGKKEGVNGILGIGGGSCLDTAKAANVLMGNPGPVNKYFDPTVPQNPGVPLVLIPTTAGTGAETSPIAAITDTSNGKKAGTFGPVCTATLAIVDPLLTIALPPKVTAMTGIDTLAHAIESYTSNLCTPVSGILALEAVALAAKSLKTAVQDGTNVQARYDMSLSCTLAGMAFSTAFPHLGHAMGTQTGVRYHLPHGLAVAPMLPATVEFISDVMPEKLRKIAKAMNLDIPEDLSNEAFGEALGDALRKLNKELGLPTLREMNIPEDDLPLLAEDTFEQVALLSFTPKAVDRAAVLKLLRKEYAL